MDDLARLARRCLRARCTSCQGSGEEQYGLVKNPETMACQACQGTGQPAWATALRERLTEPCTNCHGEGRDEVDFGCRHCGGNLTASGTGRVLRAWDNEPPDALWGVLYGWALDFPRDGLYEVFYRVLSMSGSASRPEAALQAADAALNALGVPALDD